MLTLAMYRLGMVKSSPIQVGRVLPLRRAFLLASPPLPAVTSPLG